MRKVLINALKSVIGQDFELNDVLFQGVNQNNIRSVMEMVGFTYVLVHAEKETPSEIQMLLNERLVVIDMDKETFHTHEAIRCIEGKYFYLEEDVTVARRGSTFVRPTGPSEELTKGLRKKILKGLASV